MQVHTTHSTVLVADSLLHQVSRITATWAQRISDHTTKHSISCIRASARTTTGRVNRIPAAGWSVPSHQLSHTLFEPGIHSPWRGESVLSLGREVNLWTFFYECYKSVEWRLERARRARDGVSRSTFIFGGRGGVCFLHSRGRERTRGKEMVGGRSWERRGGKGKRKGGKAIIAALLYGDSESTRLW